MCMIYMCINQFKFQKMYKYNLQEDNYEDYRSDDDEDMRMGYKGRSVQDKKLFADRSMTNRKEDKHEQQHLFRVIRERGLQLEENELNKLRVKIDKPFTQVSSNKQNSNLTGNSDILKNYTLEELISRSLKSADSSQAIQFINLLLQNKTIDQQHKNTYRLQRLQLYANQQDYQKCEIEALALLNNNSTMNQLNFAVISNLLAQARLHLPGKAWLGYMDLERAKSLLRPFRLKKEQLVFTTKKNEDSQFVDSEIDEILRNVSETELSFNARFLQETQVFHMLDPHFNCFRNREILQISAGDFHTLILVGRPLSTQSLINNKNIQKWQTQVFGIGENCVGQIDGSSSQQYFSEPILINKLSGKRISGIYSYRESSLAYDHEGNIYEWGVNSLQKSREIEVTMSLHEPLKKVQRGNLFYCALTITNKLFIWGEIHTSNQHIQTIFKQQNPKEFYILDNNNNKQSITDFSCGNNHLVIITSKGTVFSFGNNQNGQFFAKQKQENHNNKFKRLHLNLSSSLLSQPQQTTIKQIFTLHDCTFLFTSEHELYFCGKYSSKKPPQLEFKQIQFSHEIHEVISLTGHLGSYCLTSEKGQIYRWDADSNLARFRLEKQAISSIRANNRYRIVESTKSMEFKMNTLPSSISIRPLSEKILSNQQICLEITMRDHLGPFDMESVIPFRYKIFFEEQSSEVKHPRHQQSFEISENRIITIKPVKPGYYKVYLETINTQYEQTHSIFTYILVTPESKNLLDITEREYHDFQF